MKTCNPAFGFWKAARGAHTPSALDAVVEDFLDALREWFPVEVHRNVTLESREQWVDVAQRLEWAGCPEYARFLRFAFQTLCAMETGRAVSVSFIRVPAPHRRA